jgi:hypothetical protein
METVPCRQEHMDCLHSSDDHITPQGVGSRGKGGIARLTYGLSGWRGNICQAGGVSVLGAFGEATSEDTFHVLLINTGCTKQGAVRSSRIWNTA